jgi:hypothetical protein
MAARISVGGFMDDRLCKHIEHEETNGDIWVSGKLFMDDGEGTGSGWRVRTWTQPGKDFYLSVECHWVYCTTRKIHTVLVAGDKIKLGPEDTLITRERKALILATVDKWEATRFD